MVAAKQPTRDGLQPLLNACGITGEACEAAVLAAPATSQQDQHGGSIFSSRRLGSVRSVHFTPKLLAQAQVLCGRMGVPFDVFHCDDHSDSSPRLPNTMVLSGPGRQ